MFGFVTLKNSIKEVLSNKVDYLFLFFQLIYFSRIVRQTTSDEYLIIHFLITFVFVVTKSRLAMLKKYVLILLIFTLVNVLPSIMFGFNMTLFSGYILRLTIAYLIIIYLNKTFLNYFENLTFVLAYISIPLFLIQITIPGFFDTLRSITSFVDISHFHHTSSYVFIYFKNKLFRNNGFLSEPSLYGIVLAWVVLINLYLYGFKDNTKLRVFLLAMITTFSIGAYIYLIMILILFIKQNVALKYIQNLLKIAFYLLILLPFVINTEIVQNNISQMEWKIGLEEQNYEKLQAGQLDETNISRVSGGRSNFAYFLRFPLGYGMTSSDNSEFMYLGRSPNGLSKLIVTWGLGFVIFIIISSKKFVLVLKSLSPRYHNQKIGFSWFRLTDVLSVALFIIPLSGYSLFNQPFMLAFLIWPLFYYKDFIQARYQNPIESQQKLSTTTNPVTNQG
jgi:hypothetical protein